MGTTVSFAGVLGRMPWCGGPRHASVLLALFLCLLSALPGTARPIAIPPGVWLFDKKVALEIYACADLLCGRILWLKVPRDSAGDLVLDRKNPDPSLRDRELCGLTIITGLKPLGDNHWGDGRFYNPDDGKTYNVVGELVSDDLIVVRLFETTPLFGQTKTIERVPLGTTDGWC